MSDILSKCQTCGYTMMGARAICAQCGSHTVAQQAVGPAAVGAARFSHVSAVLSGGATLGLRAVDYERVAEAVRSAQPWIEVEDRFGNTLGFRPNDVAWLILVTKENQQKAEAEQRAHMLGLPPSPPPEGLAS